jgi:hypothetical protein
MGAEAKIVEKNRPLMFDRFNVPSRLAHDARDVGFVVGLVGIGISCRQALLT